MPDRERKRVPNHRSSVWKGSLHWGPSQGHRISKYLRLSKESEQDSRYEATQRGMEELHMGFPEILN